MGYLLLFVFWLVYMGYLLICCLPEKGQQAATHHFGTPSFYFDAATVTLLLPSAVKVTLGILYTHWGVVFHQIPMSWENI